MFCRLINTRFNNIKLNFIDLKELELQEPNLQLKQMFSSSCLLTLGVGLHVKGKSFFVLFFLSLNSFLFVFSHCFYLKFDMVFYFGCLDIRFIEEKFKHSVNTQFDKIKIK
jgi:hypothetical protein